MPIAVGQTSKGRTGSGTSQATTAVDTQASGSAFVVGALWNSSATFSSIADNKGNSANYVLIGSEVLFGGAGTDRSRLYYVQNGTGGSGHTSTITVSGAVAITVFFLEITGGLASGILDQNGARADNASPYTLAAGLTTTQAAELLLTMLAGASGSNPATHAESGLGSSTVHAAAEETNGASFWTGALATSIKSSTGTFNPSWTETGGGNDGVFLATFKEAAGVSIAWIKA